MAFVSSSIYHKAVNLVLKEGLDPKLFQAHRQNKALVQGAKYLPMELLFEIYELADRLLAPGFSIRQGRQLSSADYGTLGLAWRTCWRARDILIRTERYMILVTDQGSATTEDTQGFTSIKLEREVTRRGLAIANEATFVMLTNIIREVTAQDIYPQQVAFQHRSADTALFSDYFRCPVHFNVHQNYLLFSASDLNIATVKADERIHQYLMERMDEEKRGISANADTLISELHGMIRESLPSGIPGIVQLAEHLGMSTRTLKRRLGEKSLTYRELVQGIQRRQAMNFLTNTQQTVSEIAFLTGFSEQSAFNRAFRRWTGKSPSDYRNKG